MNGGRGRAGTAAALGCVLVVGVALAGCTPQPPTTTPPPSPSVVATPSPTPTATPTPDAAVKPDRPTAMDEVSAAGAEAAAVYFLQLYPYVYATGDLEEWRAMSHPECVFCASVITNVEAQVAAGEHSVGGLISVHSATTSEITPGSWFSVGVDLEQEPSQTVDVSGSALEDFPESKAYHMDIAVVRDGTRWAIRELSYTRTD